MYKFIPVYIYNYTEEHVVNIHRKRSACGYTHNSTQLPCSIQQNPSVQRHVRLTPSQRGWLKQHAESHH